MSSDEREDINFILDNRSYFIGTTSSERIMPSTVNGEAQSSQTASFLGSEKLQPAKSRDAHYFLQGGGQRLIRSYWQPNVPVPATADIQKYNREILRNREVVSLKASKSLPSQVWCVCKDGAVAIATDASGGGTPTWNRVSAYARILDTAAVQTAGRPALRVVCVKDEMGVYMCGASEAQSEPVDTFLDNWEEYYSPMQALDFTNEAVIYDSVTGTEYPASQPPTPASGMYIGYKYRTAVRTLPIASAQALRPASVKRVKFRFMESGLPWISGTPSGTADKIVSDDEWHVLDGVADVPVPGNIEMDAAFEVFTEEAKPLSIICMNIEEEA
jgi:hypothetical protein